jgi:hypothetical protein
LRGTEALTLEVGASISSSFARGLVPERFEVEPRASILLFKMSELAASFFPFAKFDYSEALWRISIRHEGAPAWFAVKCDLDHPVIRALGARLVRYPTRAARIVGSEARWSVDAAGEKLELRVSDQEAAEPPPLRRIFVPGGYEIPWNETPPTRARSARITLGDDALLRATLGDDAKLDATGIVHRGRVHMCGFARRA